MGKVTMSRFTITTTQKSTAQINKQIQKVIKRLFGKEKKIRVKVCYINKPCNIMTDYGYFVHNNKKWNIQIGSYRKERGLKRYAGIVLLWEDFR